MALTAKQEAFAQAIASGMNQSDAYRAAYNTSRMKPNSINVNASQMAADTKVALRVKELRQPVIDELQYGIKEAMAEAEEALKVCREKENGGAMVSAITLRAKLMGLLVDKKEIRSGPLDGLPTLEAAALIETIDAIQRARASAPH